MKIFLSVTLAGLFFAFTASADPVFGCGKLSQETKEIMLMWKSKSVMERFAEKWSKLLTLLIKKLTPKILVGILFLGCHLKKMVNTVEVRSGLLTKIKLIDQR